MGIGCVRKEYGVLISGKIGLCQYAVDTIHVFASVFDKNGEYIGLSKGVVKDDMRYSVRVPPYTRGAIKVRTFTQGPDQCFNIKEFEVQNKDTTLDIALKPDSYYMADHQGEKTVTLSGVIWDASEFYQGPVYLSLVCEGAEPRKIQKIFLKDFQERAPFRMEVPAGLGACTFCASRQESGPPQCPPIQVGNSDITDINLRIYWEKPQYILFSHE